MNELNPYFLAAAIVATIVALVHSALGEWMVFRKLRSGGIVPTLAAPPLQSRNIRILWATWHLASVFGLAFAALLHGAAAGRIALDSISLYALVLGFIGGSALVLVATRGRHPGWIGLLAVAVLVYLGGAS